MNTLFSMPLHTLLGIDEEHLAVHEQVSSRNLRYEFERLEFDWKSGALSNDEEQVLEKILHLASFTHQDFDTSFVIASALIELFDRPQTKPTTLQ